MNPQKHSQRSVDDIEELKRMRLGDAIDDERRKDIDVGLSR